MELLELIKTRRSIRRYQDRQVGQDALEKILEAGLYAPNAGGGQRTFVCAVRDRELCARLGRRNLECLDRSRLTGNHVSEEQPSIIDDPSIPSGFYGAPTVCVIFAPGNFLYSVADAFCCAENMVLEAAALGVSSCIVARAEDTFSGAMGKQLMREWAVPPGYLARCFVTLGYREGACPRPKPRRPGRWRIIE